MQIFEITEKINPETGISTIFDIDRFAGKETVFYQNRQEAPLCNIKALKPHRDECLCLMAKGYSIPDTINIMVLLYSNEFKNQSKKSLRSHLTRCTFYYSTHKDNLIDIIGDFNFRCKEILTKLRR